MARLKQAVAERFLRAKHDYLPGTTFFRQIDVDAIAKELAVQKQGEKDGKANIPATTSTRVSASENAILGRFQLYWEQAVDGARTAHKSYFSRASSLTSATDLETVAGEPQGVVDNLRETARSYQDDLRSAFERYREDSRALDKFREDEGLDRPVRTSHSLALKIGMLLFAVAIELGINTSAFAAGDEFGLAGALLKVTIVPILNLGIVFLVVYCLGRQINRPSAFHKAVGAFGFGAAAAWALILNLIVAHWRDALGAQFSADAGRIALQQALNTPLELSDLNSWGLLVVGVFAAVVAGADAILWRDPHPGYTAKADAKAKAEQAYVDRRADAVEHLDEVAQSAIGNLKSALLSAERNVARRPELAALVEALIQDLELYRATLTEAAENVVTRYREANQRARTTPPPARFETPVVLKLNKVTLAHLPAEKALSEPGLLAEAIRQINAGRSQAVAQLPTLQELMDREGAR